MCISHADCKLNTLAWQVMAQAWQVVVLPCQPAAVGCSACTARRRLHVTLMPLSTLWRAKAPRQAYHAGTALHAQLPEAPLMLHAQRCICTSGLQRMPASAPACLRPRCCITIAACQPSYGSGSP